MICELCNTEFLCLNTEVNRKNGRRFCTTICRNRWLASQQIIDKISCPVCGNPFNPGARKQNKTCSRKCRLAAGESKKKRTCPQCNLIFFTSNPGSNKVYCSIKCFNTSRCVAIQSVICPSCGDIFRPRTTTRKRKYCSRSCRDKHSRGPDHPSWLGNRRHERGKTWKENAKQARDRDKICICCGKDPIEIKQKLSVDHIVPFRLIRNFPNLDPNDLENLVCLCRNRHQRKTRRERYLLEGNTARFVKEVSFIIPNKRIRKALRLIEIIVGPEKE